MEINNTTKAEPDLIESSNDNWFKVSGDLDDFIFFDTEFKSESER